MADVASTLNTWSATPASNLPNDNTNIGGGLADNLQEIQAVVRRDLASRAIQITAASTVDLSLSGGPFIAVVHDSGSVAISSFGALTPGMWRIVTFYIFGGTLTLTQNPGALQLPNQVDVTVVTGDSMLIESIGTGIWQCHFYHPTSNPQLRAIAPLASAANTFPYFTGAGTAALAALSPFVRTLLDDVDSATFLNTAGAIKKTGDTMSGILVAQVAGQTSFGTAGFRSESTSGNAGFSAHTPAGGTAAYLEHVSGGNGFRVLTSAGSLARMQASIFDVSGAARIRVNTGVLEFVDSTEANYVNIRALNVIYLPGGDNAIRSAAGLVDIINHAGTVNAPLLASLLRTTGSSATASGFQLGNGTDIGTLYASAFSSSTLSGGLSGGTLTANMPAVHGGGVLNFSASQVGHVLQMTIDTLGRVTSWVLQP